MLNSITGLWTQKSKNGKPYMSAKIKDDTFDQLIELKKSGAALGNVMVFKNDNKKTDKHPDYTLMFSVEDEESGQENALPSSPPAEDVPF